MKIPVCKAANLKKKKKRQKPEKQSSAIAWIHGYLKTEHKK